MKNVKIWYLYNSGFAVKIQKKLLIFDYYDDKPFNQLPGLSGGVVTPADLMGLDVYVFVSHAHQDHHNPVIYDWDHEGQKITYIISSDVKARPVRALYPVEPHRDYTIGDLKVKTLKSNDSGVAYYVEVEGFSIFHSGDLNWWKWAQESKEWNADMAKTYKEELEVLKGLPLDFAFIPADPRMGDDYILSLKYFNDQIRPAECMVFPMHFSEQWHVFELLKADGFTEEEHVMAFSHRGQMFDIYK